jgi:nucleoid DNA-binding protein
MSLFKNLPKTYRTDIIKGVSIPGLIKNNSYFFVDLDVYEDGRINCWKFEDFEHFKKDVNRGWVAVNVPNGKDINIHGLGRYIIDESSWKFNKSTFIKYVWSIVKELNPGLNNIYKHSDKIINGIKVGDSSNGITYKELKKTQNDIFPEKVHGESINLFLCDDKNEFHLVRVDIYDIDSIIVNRIENPLDISLIDFENMIQENKILTTVPKGTKINIYEFGTFEVKETIHNTGIKDKLLEVKDIIQVLNGKMSSLDLCRQIYNQYMENPTFDLKDKLKESYEKIPKHQRSYIGDMDIKDIAVRMIIYGDQEIEQWSHYIMAKELGEELPSINIPKPKS